MINSIRIIYLLVTILLSSPLAAEEQHIALTFDYFYKNEMLGDEEINIAFPHKPEFYEATYTAKDAEGTEYSVAAVQVPDSEFDLSTFIASLVESIKTSSDKKLLLEEGQSIAWSEDGIITHLTLLRSDYFIYFLSLSDTKLVTDKAAVFAKSFAIMEGFSYD